MLGGEEDEKMMRRSIRAVLLPVAAALALVLPGAHAFAQAAPRPQTPATVPATAQPATSPAVGTWLIATEDDPDDPTLLVLAPGGVAISSMTPVIPVPPELGLGDRLFASEAYGTWSGEDGRVSFLLTSVLYSEDGKAVAALTVAATATLERPGERISGEYRTVLAVRDGGAVSDDETHRFSGLRLPTPPPPPAR